MDPVDALNRIFPDPNSFSDARYVEAKEYADACKSYLAYELAHRPDIRAQKLSSVEAPAELGKLISDTDEIRKLGNEALEKVKNVTYEIERLDNTKENLTATMRMLRQLKMLTNLYLQLDSLLKERRYEDMVGSVRAASDLIEYFRPFRPLPQIARLSQEIGEMESKIYTQVQTDFETTLKNAHMANSNNNGTANGDQRSAGSGAGAGAGAALPSDVLNAACNVLDSLDNAHGKTVNRQHLLEWYFDYMLNEYFRIFSVKDEAGSLDNVNRRYTYLKNKVILQHMGFHTHYFPEKWDVKVGLVQKASERTADDLVSLMSHLRSSNSDQIQLLLSTIQESLEFEKFSKSPPIISSRLVPYLSLWVDFQDQQLGKRISTYAKMKVPLDENDDVIPSSKELVNFYRALLTQLSKLKHQQDTVIRLAEVMAKHLGHYSSTVLIAYLPSFLRSNADVLISGKIDATTEYIKTTTHQLIDTISSQVSDADRIDTTFEEYALSKLRKVSIKVEDAMVQYIDSVVDPLWIELGSQYSAQHGRALDVSRVSPFTATLTVRLKEALSIVFKSSSTPTLVYGTASRTIDNVCIDLLTVAMARVMKPLSESQVEQMLLDAGDIKSQVLLQIPDLIPSEIMEKKGATSLKRLTGRVLDRFGQAEAVLKVLMTPSEPMETFVRNYHLLIKDRSTLNFRKILDVKGVRFQPRAMDKFKLMSSQEPTLVAENPLLRQIPTVPPPSFASPSALENGYSHGFNTSGAQGGTNGFGINNFKRIGEFLRRDHQ